ncbi:hypothetical protein [Neobacillus sp. LXY-4]|uniref:hypothetical protein n=1 Tax=Neobacillus sp. LXY-4 TaxID=3379826 RepID=UPI003EE03B7C
MFYITKYMIKQYLKFTVLHHLPGRLTLKLSDKVKVPEKYKVYDQYILKGMKLLHGIENVRFNYELATIFITYDINLVNEEKILTWTNKVIEVVLNHYELIKNHGKDNVDMVINKIEQQLKEELKIL